MGKSYSVADFHVHPDFSFDAEGSVTEFCRTAEKMGMMELCFTSHYDSNPILSERARSIRVNGDYLLHSVENFRYYVEAVQKAAEEFYPPQVRCGVEAGFYPGCENEYQKLFKTYPFYYRLGSVHEVGDIQICYEKEMKKHSQKVKAGELVDRYFALIKSAAQSGLFDAIAHIDMYKKYGLKYYGDEILTVHRGRIEPALKAMAENDVGLEINTSSLRKGHSEYYPSMDIVNMARSAGVRILSIGSDAHKPEQLGHDFAAAAAVAYELFPYTDE